MKFTLCILILSLWMFTHISAERSPPLPQEVIDFMADKDMRYHHLFFHNLRQYWHRQSAANQYRIARLGWQPPRISKAFNSTDGEVVLDDNDSGEDFLYMHRKMIENVNRISTSVNSTYGKVVGWEACPPPNDTDYPVPPAYEMPGQEGLAGYIGYIKSDKFYNDVIQPAEAAIKDPENLRRMTLGQLGAKLEYELHTWFHLRFSAANPIGYRIQSNNPLEEIDDSWNDPKYDWLADFYSAHVNEHFWKIHGWIEDRIEDWRVANNVDTIVWKGTWERGPMSTLNDLFAAGGEPVSLNYASEGNTNTGGDDSADGSEGDDYEVDEETLTTVVKLLLEASRKKRN